MTDFETLSLVIMTLGLITAIVAALFALRNLKLIVKSHSDNHEWNRRIATQEALTKLREINLDSLNREFGFANQLNAIPLKKVLDKFEESPELQNSCHHLLNFYEGLASGVHLGIYDERTVKINRRGAIERDFAKFREYISHRRDMVSNTLYIEIEKLIAKWRAELMDASTREITGDISG